MTTLQALISPSRRLRARYLRFHPDVWVVGALSVGLFSFMTSEPALTAACLLALPVGASLLWRRGEPPVLFAAFFLQWLSVSTGVFRADLQGQTLQTSYGVPGVVTAAWLSLIGLLVLAAGMRIALRGAPPIRFDVLRAEVRQYRLQRVMIAYLGAWIALSGLEVIMWRVPGLGQLLFALANFRWAFFFVLAVTVLVQRRGYPLLALAFGMELIAGFTSFFSEFRLVFFVFALAFLTARSRLKQRTVLVLMVVFAAVLTISAMWSLVKGDYREFLNQGTGRQVVLVGPVERIEKLYELVSDAGLKSLPSGFEALANRIQYIEYFGRVVDYVPAVVPHEGGAIWWCAVRHVLMPRLFFPNKPALTPDVVMLERFTGARIIVQAGRNTEVPMGYMAESYIDFGAWGMFLPIGLLGILYGLGYRYFVSRPHYLLFALGAMAGIAELTMRFEVTSAKILGGGLTSFAAMFLALKFGAPYVHRWLTGDHALRSNTESLTRVRAVKR